MRAAPSTDWPPPRGVLSLPLMTEVVILAIAIAALLLLPGQVPLLTGLVVTMIFVLSLDLVLGLAGILTLGHAALFGAGAYAAGYAAHHLHPEPLLGLLCGIAGGAGVALISGALILRADGLRRLALTLLVAELLRNLALMLPPLTVEARTVLGLIPLDGQVGYLLALGLLLVVILGLRRLSRSAFGLTITGLRTNPVRAAAIGAPVRARLILVYTIGGGIAGLAGALSVQLIAPPTPALFGIVLSLEALIMLGIGGAGRIYGAVLGALVFGLLVQGGLVGGAANLLLTAALLLGVVFFLPGGLMALQAALRRWRG